MTSDGPMTGATPSEEFSPQIGSTCTILNPLAGPQAIRRQATSTATEVP